MRTRNQVQNNTHIRKNQKNLEKDKSELVVKIYPERKQLNIQQYKIDLPDYPSCQIIIGLCLIKIIFDQNVNIKFLYKNIKLIENYFGEILIFLLDYHMQKKE